MAWPKNVLVVYNGKPNSTSGNLFRALAEAIAEHTDCDIDANADPGFSPRALISTLWMNLRRVKKVIRAEVLVLHSYLIFSLPSILVARIFGVKIVSFQWDIYPSTLSGKRLNHSALRMIVDWIEAKLGRMVHRIIVPSADFLPFVQHSNLQTMPIWPTLTAVKKTCNPRDHSPQAAPWRLCFAGQVTPLRALDLAVDHLQANASQPFELHVFSGDSLPEELCNRTDITVIHHGYLPREELAVQMSKMHFGLISLHPDMDQPGFPSKMFDFVAAGLPVLYFGRPLPAFSALLQNTGVGHDITGKVSIDFDRLYNKISAQFPAFQAHLFDETGLAPKRLEKILEFYR